MYKSFWHREKVVCALFIVIFLTGAAACQEKGSAVSNPTPPKEITQKLSDFDGQRALNHVKVLVEIGQRTSGSAGIKKAQNYIENELKSYGLSITEEPFEATTPRGKIPMKNIIGELTGQRSEIVIICSHYDTKVLPGFVGANDGGSSTGAVLEIARVLAGSKPEYTVWFAFFDGEEALVDWGAMGGLDNTYGSRHMAEKMQSNGTINRVKGVVLLDMIGDKSLDLKRDVESTRWMVDLFWETARNIGYGKYFLGNSTAIADDHLPFRKAGVPVIDIIDFDYGPDNSYWHTEQDTIDKLSTESLKVVGDTVISAMPELYRQLKLDHQVTYKQSE